MNAVDAYVARLAALLSDVHGRDRTRILDEVRAHLQDALTEERAAGTPDPEVAAVRRFGPADERARELIGAWLRTRRQRGRAAVVLYAGLAAGVGGMLVVMWRLAPEVSMWWTALGFGIMALAQGTYLVATWLRLPTEPTPSTMRTWRRFERRWSYATIAGVAWLGLWQAAAQIWRAAHAGRVAAVWFAVAALAVQALILTLAGRWMFRLLHRAR